jgi:hypothetical protein
MNKNIFFLFPPGYSGNYLQWIINVSEESKKEFTVKNPLLPNGTSHAFVRRPTHMGVFNILNWIIKNNPALPQTFILYTNAAKESWIDHPAHAAYRLLKSYPTGLFVNIYASTEDDIKVGALNSYTKWTTWMYDQTAFGPSKTPTFDWEGGKNNIISISDRNWLVEHWRSFFAINDRPFNWEELTYNIDSFKRWYNVRRELEPAETDPEQFNNFEPFPFDNILDISLSEIYSSDFLNTTKFTQWVESQNAGTFDWEYAKSYHQVYLDAQDNLQWFTHITAMREQKLVSRWLLKHTLGQAFVLEEVKDQLGHDNSWQEKPTEQVLLELGFKILN